MSCLMSLLLHQFALVITIAALVKIISCACSSVPCGLLVCRRFSPLLGSSRQTDRQTGWRWWFRISGYVDAWLMVLSDEEDSGASISLVFPSSNLSGWFMWWCFCECYQVCCELEVIHGEVIHSCQIDSITESSCVALLHSQRYLFMLVIICNPEI